MRYPCQEGAAAIKEGFLPELWGMFIFKLMVRLVLSFAKLQNNWASYSFTASQWEQGSDHLPSGELGRAFIEYPLASVSQPHFKGILSTHLWSCRSCDLEEAGAGPFVPKDWWEGGWAAWKMPCRTPCRTMGSIDEVLAFIGWAAISVIHSQAQGLNCRTN